jgi:hypothetical protein
MALDATTLGQAIAGALKDALVKPQNLPPSQAAPINAAMDKLGGAIAAGVVPHLVANAEITVDAGTMKGTLK